MNDVRGLSQGSVVQLMGLPVGNVDEITFDKKGNLVLVLLINKKFQKRITEGSTAGLRTQGALGDKFVFVTPGPMTASPLKNGSYIETEIGGDLFTTLSERGDQLEYLFEIIKDTRDVMKDLKGDGELRVIIKELAIASKNLSQFSQDLNADQGGKDLNKSLKKLNQILAKIDNGSGSLGALINDPSLYNKLRVLLGEKNVSPIKSAIRDAIQESEN